MLDGRQARARRLIASEAGPAGGAEPDQGAELKQGAEPKEGAGAHDRSWRLWLQQTLTPGWKVKPRLELLWYVNTQPQACGSSLPFARLPFS